jgi:anthranilate/para-aminobenzoate synthase component II
MNVLLVDNKSAHLENLRDLVEHVFVDVQFRVHDPRNMHTDDVEWADLVVISGGTGRSIIKNPLTFKRMVSMCVEYAKPTIGICLGGEAIATYFGSTMHEIPVRRVGNVRLQVDEEFSAAAGLPEITMVYEFHKWVLDSVKTPLVCLATTKDGPELFRHESLPIWGMQFHPEVRRLNSKGFEIFRQVVTELGLLQHAQ